jgi:hypothetical protein
MGIKACILGNTSLGYSWFVRTYKQGLKLNGYEVIEIDYKTTPLNEIKKRLLSEKPAIVFTHLTFHKIYPIPTVLNMYRELYQKGIKIIHLCYDARTKDRYMENVSGAFSAALVGNIPLRDNCIKAWKIPVHYLPYASMTYDKMALPEKDLMFREAVFTGNKDAHMDRKNFIERLSKRIPIKIFHTQSKGDLRNKTHALSASAKCILGLCTGYDIPFFFEVRHFQYLGSGACLLARKFIGLDDFIPDNLYYSINSYDNDGVDLATEHYNKILKTNTRPMQEEAFKFMQATHSSKVRIAEVLKFLKEDGIL